MVRGNFASARREIRFLDLGTKRIDLVNEKSYKKQKVKKYFRLPNDASSLHRRDSIKDEAALLAKTHMMDIAGNRNDW